MQAIILAGGQGTRLKPFTANIPKPLVPIGDMPILEVVLKQLKQRGFRDIVIAVNHLAELIEAFFGDGRKLGLKIRYSIEDKKLGTAGPLALVKNLDDNFLVMNGDILTTLDYADLFRRHKKSGGIATIAAYKNEVTIDLGVLKIRDGRFEDYIEKPTYKFDVSMGVYVFNRRIMEFIPRNKPLDMPELMLSLKKSGQPVGCYSGSYYWLDIGRVSDYETAVEIFNKKKKSFLPHG